MRDDGGVTHLGPFRALDHTFAVTVKGTAPVDLGDVLGGLADPGATPTATYGFTFDRDGQDDGVLSVDGVELASGRTRILLQMLITRLGRAIADLEPGGAIHATTLRVGDGTVLLAGPTGRGKSTLSARLLLDGAALVAEDISVLDPTTLEVRPYHRPVGLSERSFEVLGVPIPPAAGEPCGCGGKVLATAAHLGAGLAGPSRPTVLALVDQQDDTLQLPTLVERHGDRIDCYAGTEAVVVEGDRSHLLNQSAAAVWLLRNEGLDRDAIAAELQADPALVDDALAELRALG